MRMTGRIKTADMEVVYSADCKPLGVEVWPSLPGLATLDSESVELESFNLLGHDFPLSEIPVWLEIILHEISGRAIWSRALD